ncbi:DUF6776 family protein [Lamprocystis purpurea]|uniref:DUF6776 family protein n=1 Tax=Lamprocystis purpurea TaxID=61598 RepID=UPI0012F8A063|nr:DUF6776 family protein [Lamprocystis purpurea]
MSGHSPRLWWHLLALAGYAVLVAAAFWLGFELGQRDATTITADGSPDPGAVSAEATMKFQEEITALRQEGVVLERTRQIALETNRSLQDQLKQVQGERLALIKEASYLKRLIQEGGRGAVRVADLRLTRGEGVVRYAFTLTQLSPGFGESRGEVKLLVTGTAQGQERSFDLSQLPHADPRHLTMRFEHFQRIQGEFSLPADLVPTMLALTLVPEGDQLAETFESFPWVLNDQ